MSDYRRPGAARQGASARGRASTAGETAPARGTNAARGTSNQKAASPARGKSVGRGAPRLKIPRLRAGGSASSDRTPAGFWTLAAIGVGVVLLGFVLQCAMPQGFPVANRASGEQPARRMVTEIHSSGPLRINEIMSANGGVMTDSAGETPDWIEIANIGARDVSLKGWALAHDAKRGSVFLFPDMALAPGECAIVFADGTLRSEAGEELHAPFRLSSGGDTLMLFNASDVAVDTVNIPALAENEAYARTGASGWEITQYPTPGTLNDADPAAALADSPVHIVELMASSAHYGPDENGVCHDYVILENASGADVNVGGWYLSDSARLPRLWRVPTGTVIPAGSRLLVHCSGLNRTGDPAHLHTGFKLASEGEQAVLTNAQGQLVDVVDFDVLKTDAAYVRAPDGSWSVGQPTAPRA